MNSPLLKNDGLPVTFKFSTSKPKKDPLTEYILIESNAQPHMFTTRVYLDKQRSINPILKDLFFPELDLDKIFHPLTSGEPLLNEEGDHFYKTEDYSYSAYEVWGSRNLEKLNTLMEYEVFFDKVGQIEYSIKDYVENPPPFFTKADKIYHSGFKHYRVRCVDSPDDVLVFDSKDPRFDIYFKDKSGLQPFVAGWLKSITNNAGYKIWS